MHRALVYGFDMRLLPSFKIKYFGQTLKSAVTQFNTASRRRLFWWLVRLYVRCGLGLSSVLELWFLESFDHFFTLFSEFSYKEMPFRWTQDFLKSSVLPAGFHSLRFYFILSCFSPRSPWFLWASGGAYIIMNLGYTFPVFARNLQEWWRQINGSNLRFKVFQHNRIYSIYVFSFCDVCSIQYC